MALDKLNLTPEKQGYTIQYGNNVLRTELDGGQPRYRLDRLGKQHTITVNFICDIVSYRYLILFYRYTLVEGSKEFLIDLMVDIPCQVMEHVANIRPGTFRLSSVSGSVYNVSCVLDVKPNPIPENADDYMAWFEEFGLEPGAGLYEESLLNQIMNEDLPQYMEVS